MKRMGIQAVYRKPNTSKPAPGHKIYPYLLRDLAITRPNQIWAMDITYIPMARGFVYLAAVIDWFSRRVLSWRLSITMEAGFCVEAVEEALARHGKPEIFNTDQGSQFTSTAFTGLLTGNAIAISMEVAMGGASPGARGRGASPGRPHQVADRPPGNGRPAD
jgi:putative transposase